MRTLGQARVAGFLDRPDVHEHVWATIIRSNKAVAFGSVKPLHFTYRQVDISQSKTVSQV